ncbi:MAG TPA: hypothetical protein VHP56_03825 [Solirubrobacterales bacterium]|jgi:hypothetical protein|nr:hypothetical protein [Solirubrobacterales bacterium]
MTRARVVVVVLVSHLLALVAATPASATYDPIASGATVLQLDKSFFGLLRAHGVAISTREGASFAKGSLRFPVSGGKFDPGARKGTVEHEGTALFRRGSRRLAFKDLQLKATRRSSPLVARLGGGQLKLGPARGLTIARHGFGERISVASMRLTAKFATRLSKRLGLRGVFEEGMPVGSAVTSTDPAAVTILPKRTAQLELDPAMAAKLNDLHVAVNPIFPAERPGLFTLPIFSGKMALGFDSGFLQLQGGIEFIQLGGGQVIWRESRTDLDARTLNPEVEVLPSPPYPGKAGQLPVAALDLDTGAPVANSSSRTLTVTGATLALSDLTAALFDGVFAKNQDKQGSFRGGEILGRLSFVAEAQ